MDLNDLKAIVAGACSDITDSEAEGDAMYNDVAVMHDLIGYRIYDEPNRDDLLCEMLEDDSIFSRVAERIIERM